MDISKMARGDASFSAPCCRLFPHAQPTLSCRLWQTCQRPSARNNFAQPFTSPPAASQSPTSSSVATTPAGSHKKAPILGSIKGGAILEKRGLLGGDGQLKKGWQISDPKEEIPERKKREKSQGRKRKESKTCALLSFFFVSIASIILGYKVVHSHYVFFVIFC